MPAFQVYSAEKLSNLINLKMHLQIFQLCCNFCLVYVTNFYNDLDSYFINQ